MVSKKDGLTDKDRKFAMVLAMSLSEKFGLKTGAILASAATMAMVINEFGETLRFMEPRKEEIKKKPIGVTPRWRKGNRVSFI